MFLISSNKCLFTHPISLVRYYTLVPDHCAWTTWCCIPHSSPAWNNMNCITTKPNLIYSYNKGAYQPTHPRNLISTFMVRFLDRMVLIVAVSKLSRYMLASVTEHASWSLTWSQISGDRFSHDLTHYYGANYICAYLVFVASIPLRSTLWIRLRSFDEGPISQTICWAHNYISFKAELTNDEITRYYYVKK